MATGSRPTDGLSVAQQERIEHAVTTCRQEHGLDVSVFVGDLILDGLDFREGAERLHASLGERAHGAMLLVVAPGQRKVEIVTGPAALWNCQSRAVTSLTTKYPATTLRASASLT